jgi:hypothetical protein
VLKIDDLKFFACPLSFISSKSWQMLELVNETTDLETGRILHLPYPGTITQQPEWYREAVKIKRNERLSEWYSEELDKRLKKKSKQ